MVTLVDMEPSFRWYAVVSSTMPLEQGDLLDNFPIVIPPASIAEVLDEPIGYEIEASSTVERFNVIVMTQSCDLIKLGQEDEVILCPRHGYLELVAERPKFGGRDGWKKLIDGRFIGAHIINKCDVEVMNFDYQVIDLQRIFSVPLAIVNQVAANQGDRVRLLPPYREHLAQAFARQFMRVGLPVDLPQEYPSRIP